MSSHVCFAVIIVKGLKFINLPSVTLCNFGSKRTDNVFSCFHGQ